jgi:hypothetical protein
MLVTRAEPRCLLNDGGSQVERIGRPQFGRGAQLGSLVDDASVNGCYLHIGSNKEGVVKLEQSSVA